jgi:hypothetical protein
MQAVGWQPPPALTAGGRLEPQQGAGERGGEQRRRGGDELGERPCRPARTADLGRRACPAGSQGCRLTPHASCVVPPNLHPPAVRLQRWLGPEVTSGGPATLAADVYSGSMVLWELLTWQLPWAGENNTWEVCLVVWMSGDVACGGVESLWGSAAGWWWCVWVMWGGSWGWNHSCAVGGVWGPGGLGVFVGVGCVCVCGGGGGKQPRHFPSAFHAVVLCTCCLLCMCPVPGTGSHAGACTSMFKT